MDATVEGLDAALSALEDGRPALVWRKMIADTITPVGAALRLIKRERGDFLLESVEGGEIRGRYSLIGLDPDLVFQADGDIARINRRWTSSRDAFEPAGQNTLDALRNLLTECRIDVPDALPPALACLVGYFSYETIGLVESIPSPAARPLSLPDMLFVRPQILIVFDSLLDTLYCIAPVWPAKQAADAVSAASARIRSTLALLQSEVRGTHVSASQQPDDPLPQPQMAAHDYAAGVERAKEYIVAGDIFQVVLSQRFTASFALPPIDLYRALRRINPSPFLYLLDLPGFALIGSSPEILVRVRDGDVTVRPIAGTRPRGPTVVKDVENERSLLADAKERAEHLMLLDLGRNDIGRVAEQGTVAVTDSFQVERYSHVMHIVSNVTARLDPNKDAIDALFAGFPAGTVSGAPKIRACEIIAELEHDARGPYAGGVGYFAFDGSMDSCIVLRTAILKDGMMHVQAGAGIVADSEAEYEQRECEAKAGALFAAAREAVRLAQEHV